MTTKFIGMKDFRQNMASYVKASRKGGIRYIILKKNVPVLEVKAIDEKEFAMEKLAQETTEAREQVKRGEVYSLEEVMKKLRLLQVPSSKPVMPTSSAKQQKKLRKN